MKLSKETIEELKKRVDLVGKLAVSDACGIAYSTLCNKLSRYCPMTEEDAKCIEAGIEIVKRQKKAA